MCSCCLVLSHTFQPTSLIWPPNITYWLFIGNATYCNLELSASQAGALPLVYSLAETKVKIWTPVHRYLHIIAARISTELTWWSALDWTKEESRISLEGKIWIQKVCETLLLKSIFKLLTCTETSEVVLEASQWIHPYFSILLGFQKTNCPSPHYSTYQDSPVAYYNLAN